MCIYTQVSKHIYVCVYIYFQILFALSNDIPVAMNTSSAQILVSNIIPQYKELGLLGEMADSGAKAENIQGEHGVPHSARK